MYEPSLRDIIKTTKWRQGVIVEGEQRKKVLSYVIKSYPWIENSDILVLFSQNCDLLNPSLENEPFAEFFCAKNIIKPDTSLAYGKNPRKIHLTINDSKSICLSINHRIRIDRTLLAEISLDNEPQKLSDSELNNLLSWVSKKYSRPAFPDRFNELLAQIPKLDKKLKQLNDSFKEIKSFFFYLSPNSEIEKGQLYSLRIKVLLVGQYFDGCEQKKDSICDRLEHILSTKKIEITDVCCAYEDEMTLFELHYFKLWDKDYISRRYDLVL